MARKRKQQTIRIENWSDLCKFVKDMNPYKETVVLSGYLNKINEKGKLEVVSLYFTTKPVDILKDDME